MERSRGRSLLGLALLVIGVIWLSSALARSFAGPPHPAPPPAPVVQAVPDLPALPELPARPAMPAAPSLPEPPAMPDLPPLPPLPPAPRAPFFIPGFVISTPVVLLALVALLLWWRGRGARERPAA